MTAEIEATSDVLQHVAPADVTPSPRPGPAPAPRGETPATTVAAVAAAAALLAACGGGGGSEPVASTPPPAPAPTPGSLSAAEAARLLSQASFGATRVEVERAQVLGAAAWVDQQLALPRSMSHVDWLRAKGYEIEDNRSSRVPLDRTLWRKFLGGPDQLRQRMVYALSQIMVIGVEGVGGGWPAFSAAYFMDVLEANAFGNFRTLLEQVTLSPAMGVFLSMRGSQKADPVSGRRPDENYAREVMQLFTIGLNELNADGSLRLVSGVSRDSYTEADVSGLARVFTGWDFAPLGGGLPATQFVSPMVNTASRHETGSKSFLGTTIAANTSGVNSLRAALDTLAGHANVGPLISRQLIQRLVTSNPSPAYMGRVAAVFANNGSGVRGDLRAVLRALLLDAEARIAPTGNSSGKLREPVLRFTQWARAAGIHTLSDEWRLGNLSDPATRLGQSPLHSTSVFNFYRPGYVPPNTGMASAGLVAPEFQITTETSVAGFINFMQTVVSATNSVNASDLRTDYSAWLPLATDPAALAAEANLLLAAGQLSAERQTGIASVVAGMASGTDAQRLSRVHAAILLTLAAPEAAVLK